MATQLAPITKRNRETFIGGPDSGRTRRECWGADTVDGVWSIERTEDPGTPWVIRHNPTGEFVAWDGGRRDDNGRPAPCWTTGFAHSFGTLKAARTWIAETGTTWTEVAA